MSNYLMKFKGKYRLLPELDIETNDFPRDYDGGICDSYDDIYIACANNIKIFTYSGRKKLLSVYIPSIGRGRNIKKYMDENNISYSNYTETDTEVEFRIKVKDIEQFESILKIKTFGANISPFSSKNLPKDTSVKIPEEEMKKYKTVVSEFISDKSNLLKLVGIQNTFLSSVLEKRFRKQDKSFDYKADMKKLKMSRLVKEYIYTKCMWEDYLVFLKKEISNSMKGDKLYD